MWTIIGDGLIDHIVAFHPLSHPADVVGVVLVAKQAPLGKGDWFLMAPREVDMIPQSVPFGNEILKAPTRRLVVTIEADNIDHIVPGIAACPWDVVATACGGEIEAESGPRHRPHGRNYPPPVNLPNRWIRSTPSAISGAVHFPAQDNDRIGCSAADQAFGEAHEMNIKGTCRPAPQQGRYDLVRECRLVRRHHRNVHHQQPAWIGRAPRHPRIDYLGRTLNSGPILPWKISTPYGNPRSEPLLEILNPLDPLRTGPEKGAQRNGLFASIDLTRLKPHGRHRNDDQASRDHKRHRRWREPTEATETTVRVGVQMVRCAHAGLLPTTPVPMPMIDFALAVSRPDKRDNPE